MADSNQRPCKVSYNGSLRRFFVAQPAVWQDFENKIRTVYNIPGNLALDVQYKDEEGDLITLNTDSELDDVFTMHALFTPLAPVKFNVIAKGQSSFHDISLFSTRTNSIMGDDDTRSQSGRSQISSSVCESYHSDNVSLIDLDEEKDKITEETHLPLEETPIAAAVETLEQSINYPQQDLKDATYLQKEIDRLESFKLDAPIFTSSLLAAGIENSPNQDSRNEGTINVQDTKSSIESSVSTLSEAFADYSASVKELSMQNDRETEAGNRKKDYRVEVEPVPRVTDPTNSVNEPANVTPPPPTVPTSTASTSTSQHYNISDDTALIEQFQLLIKEFQEIIQNNPQLVSLAGNIMNKILSNVKVNVESFANYLHAQAQTVAQNSQQVAAEKSTRIHEAATRAAVQAQEATNRAATQVQEAASKAVAQAQEVASKASIQAQEAVAQAQEVASMASLQAQEAVAQLHKTTQFQQQQRSLFPQPACHRGSFRSLYPHHHGIMGQDQHNSALSALFGQPITTPTSVAPVDPIAPIPPMPPMAPLAPLVLPPLTPLAPVASPSDSNSFSTASIGLARSSTIHSSKPSPFSRGFPFNTNLPSTQMATALRSDRPVATDTEAIGACSASSSIPANTGKAVDTNGSPNKQGSSSTAMPGSFPQSSQTTNLKPGWSWARLPDDGPEHVQPPSTRAKYGWVWNDAGGEKAEITENQVPTSSLYSHLKSTMTTTPGSFPSSSQSYPSATEKLQRRQTVHQFGRKTTNESQTPALAEDSEHHEQQTHILREQYQSIAAAVQEGQRRVLDESAAFMEEQNREMKAQQRAILDQRQALEALRREQAQQRLDQMASRTRPLSYSASMGHRSSRLQDSNRTNSLYSDNSTHSRTSTPGGFPTVAPLRASASIPTPIQAPVSVQEPTPAPVQAASPAEVNPFSDPSDFEMEIQTLVSMGFANTPELRTVVRDFGGEVEAVVEFLVSK
ncbi:hypothetical protein FBU30_002903 [Linnemannia zychae]|nr:hypothetical protein FBU30_002903 [Linnemannia zychae]